MHPDGYIELRDRKKDIIISGGENISTIEVEHVIVKHPAVLECAVVGDAGREVGRGAEGVRARCARARRSAEAELIAFCRERLAHFKCPKAGRVRRAAEDVDRQDPEVQAARAGVEGAGEADLRRAGFFVALDSRRYAPGAADRSRASPSCNASSKRRLLPSSGKLARTLTKRVPSGISSVSEPTSRSGSRQRRNAT